MPLAIHGISSKRFSKITSSTFPDFDNMTKNSNATRVTVLSNIRSRFARFLRISHLGKLSAVVSASNIAYSAGAAVLIFLLLRVRQLFHQVTASTSGSNQKRDALLHQVNPLAQEDVTKGVGVDIIAIHGFDTDSPNTWIHKEKGEVDVNWLEDEHMLPAEVSNVRIFTCNWPAELFQQSNRDPDKIEELARLLLAGILGRGSLTTNRNRPILFIASCFGGVVLMKALVMAEGYFSPVQEATRGIIFLATPFNGTSFSDIAKWADPGLKAWASIRGRQVSGVLDWVSPKWDLDELVREFTILYTKRLMEPIPFEISTYYEKQYTDLSTKVFVLGFVPFLFTRSKQVSDRANLSREMPRFATDKV